MATTAGGAGGGGGGETADTGQYSTEPLHCILQGKIFSYNKYLFHINTQIVRRSPRIIL